MSRIVVPVKPNEQAIFRILGEFLTQVLPVGVEVRQGQTNRVAPPAVLDYVVMWPTLWTRLSTNIDEYQDFSFMGSVSGDMLSVTEIVSAFGLGTGGIGVGGIGTMGIGTSIAFLKVGSHLYGPGMLPYTVITALGTGTGGVGTYTVSKAQAVGPELMAAGEKSLLQPASIQVQVDVHGPGSWDNANTITTVFRDPTGVDLFNEQWFELFADEEFGLQPLYCDDPRQMPFTNDQDQVENRWVVLTRMQANQTLSVPSQFATSTNLRLRNAAAFPA